MAVIAGGEILDDAAHHAGCADIVDIGHRFGLLVVPFRRFHRPIYASQINNAVDIPDLRAASFDSVQIGHIHGDIAGLAGQLLDQRLQAIL